MGRNVVHFTRDWRCASLPGLWMSLRGAKRRGNPYSLRQRKTKSSTLGEFEVVYEFALSATFPYLSLRGSGLPRRFAPRNDMQKIAALLRVQEGACRGKPATAHEFALSATFPYLSLRGRGLPHQCAHWFAMTCRRKDVCAGARTLLAMTCKRLSRCYVCAGARTLSGSTPAMPPNYANTRQVYGCHCEERSDVAIRTLCGSAKRKAALRANSK